MMNRDIRRKDRMITDPSEIEDIVKNAKILHLGLNDDGFPYIVPLHYGYEYNSEKSKYIFYMHGARVGHKLDLINKNSNAGVELETDVEPVSGGDIPCSYGSFYSSLIGRGQASIVNDEEEKKHGLDLLMRNQVGRAFEFTEAMIASVAVIKVEVGEYTVKARKKL